MGAVCAGVLLIITLIVMRRRQPKKIPEAPSTPPPLPPPRSVDVAGFDLYHSKEGDQHYTEIPELQQQIKEKILNSDSHAGINQQSSINPYIVELPDNIGLLTDKDIEDAYKDPTSLGVVVTNDYADINNVENHGEGKNYDTVSISDAGKSAANDVKGDASDSKQRKRYENVDVEEKDPKTVKSDEIVHPITLEKNNSPYEVIDTDDDDEKEEKAANVQQPLDNPYETVDNEKQEQATVVVVRPPAVSDSDYRRTIDKNTV